MSKFVILHKENYSGSVVKTKIQAFVMNQVSVAELGVPPLSSMIVAVRIII